ncbi:MAG: hypothetical protein L3J31_07995, partial [Bacteroidales bacterium]|nr:hypothetical protein [Bacteroidales bacterium]
MNNIKNVVIGGRFLLTLLLLLALSAQAQDFYWRGGTGNWSDPSNWSSDNGGIPTAFDNVIFDAASFTADNQRVTIDRDAVCKGMDWSAVDRPVRFAGKSKLTVFGSFRLHQQMTIIFTGDIYFRSKKKEQKIDFAGVQLQSNLVFEGEGQWDFLSIIDIGESDISLLEGEINTKGKTVICGSFISTGAKNRKIVLGASLIKITAHGGHWEVTNSLTLNRGSSRIWFNCPNPLSEMLFDGAGLHYNKLEFSNSVEILGNNTIEQLKLNAGISCKLEGGKTQTVNQKLIARGCSGLIDIQSTNQEHAIIKKSGGSVNISFVGLRLIQANILSDGSFNAYNSVDNGNNIACNIYANSRDMYWLNGTGNWSDTLHWTSQNNDFDAKCVPLPYDNVFFDENSFSGNDTVRLDLVSASCSDLMWTSNKSAALVNVHDSSRLVVYGTLRFSQKMKNLFSGEFSFRDTVGNQFIETSGNSFKGDLDFSGENGEWDLKGALKVEGRINFQKGSLNSKNHPIICNSFVSDSAWQRALNLGTSLMRIKKSSRSIREPGLSLNTVNLQFNQSKLRIEMTGEDALLKTCGGDTLRFHQVSFTSSSGLATLRNDSTYSIFQRVSFASNANILGNNMFDTIMISEACVYGLPNGRTQTINNEIIAPVSCEGTSILRCSSSGGAARLKMMTDTLFLNYVSLKDIWVLPPAVYIARNAVDLGNNQGWDEISGPAQRDLYWVGGSGDWNETQHWSSSSNGLGGECVPTPIDNVTFDKHSFAGAGNQVTVNLNNAFVNNLIWSKEIDEPVFSTSEPRDLRVFGSLILTDKVKFHFKGPIWFESSEPGNTIKTNGVKFHNIENDFYFNGVGGEWTLLDELDLGNNVTLRNSVFLMNGSLFFNDQTVKCWRFYSAYGTFRGLSLGSSQLFINNYWYLDGRNLSMYENTARIQIERGHLFQRNAGTIRYYD